MNLARRLGRGGGGSLSSRQPQVPGPPGCLPQKPGSPCLRGPGALTGETPQEPHCRLLGSDCPPPSPSWRPGSSSTALIISRSSSHFLQDSEKLLGTGFKSS